MNNNKPASISFRPAVKSDIESIERLILENFSHVIQATMGKKSDDVKLAVLIGLRKSRLQPIANVFVATAETGRPIGVIAYETQKTITGFQKDRLAVIKQLGYRGMFRFLLMARFTISKNIPLPHHAYMRLMAVDKAYRRQKIGHRLWIYVEQAAKDDGYKKVTCYMADNNKAALNLAAKMKYVQNGIKKTFWRGRILGEEKLIYLEKNL